MKINELIQHFAFEKVGQWLNFPQAKGGRRKMILGIVISQREYLALPISFKSEVIFEYCPFYQVSLN